MRRDRIGDEAGQGRPEDSTTQLRSDAMLQEHKSCIARPACIHVCGVQLDTLSAIPPRHDNIYCLYRHVQNITS